MEVCRTCGGISIVITALGTLPRDLRTWLKIIATEEDLQSWTKCSGHFINFGLNNTTTIPSSLPLFQCCKILTSIHTPIGKKLFQHCRRRKICKLISLDTVGALHFVTILNLA